jgi:hypothetical protein
MASTYHSVLDTDNNMRGDISLEHNSDNLSYHKYHIDIDAPQHVHEDVPTHYSVNKQFMTHIIAVKYNP